MPVDELLSKPYLAKRAELFDPKRSTAVINKGTPIASSDTVLFEVVDQYGCVELLLHRCEEQNTDSSSLLPDLFDPLLLDLVAALLDPASTSSRLSSPHSAH